MEDEQPFSIVDLLGGIFVGLVIGVACFLLDVPVVALLGRFTPFSKCTRIRSFGRIRVKKTRPRVRPRDADLVIFGVHS